MTGSGKAPGDPADVVREVLADGSIRLSCGGCCGGSVLVSHPAPGVMLNRSAGQGLYAFCSFLEAELRRSVATRAPVLVFIDARELDSVETKFRLHWTEYCRHYRAELGPSCILVRSRIVAMAATVMNMALGANMLEVLNDAGAFQQRLRGAIASRGR